MSYGDENACIDPGSGYVQKRATLGDARIDKAMSPLMQLRDRVGQATERLRSGIGEMHALADKAFGPPPPSPERAETKPHIDTSGYGGELGDAMAMVRELEIAVDMMRGAVHNRLAPYLD